MKQNFRWAQTPTQCQQVINQVYLIFRFDEDKWGTCAEVTWCIKAFLVLSMINGDRKTK